MQSSYSSPGHACMNSRYSLNLESAIIIQSNPIILRQPCLHEFGSLDQLPGPEMSNPCPHDSTPLGQTHVMPPLSNPVTCPLSSSVRVKSTLLHQKVVNLFL